MAGFKWYSMKLGLCFNPVFSINCEIDSSSCPSTFINSITKGLFVWNKSRACSGTCSGTCSGASPPCRPCPTRPTQSGFGFPAHGIRAGNSTPTDNASPFTVIADLPLSKGVPEGRGIKVPLAVDSIGCKQPCHANVGLCDGGHLWLRFCLHCPAIR